MRLLCTMISEGRADPSTNECWDYLPDEMAVYQAGCRNADPGRTDIGRISVAIGRGLPGPRTSWWR